MKEERILNALGSVRDEYVAEAAPAVGRSSRRRVRRVAAVVLLLLGAALFTQTAPGAAAAAFVGERVAELIETLFPPKEITVIVEGSAEKEPYTAGGQVPHRDETADSSGFAVYYDPTIYEMTEEDGKTYIRSIPMLPTREELRANNGALLEGLSPEAAEETLDALLAQQEAAYAALPRCELEIAHVPETPPEEWAAAVQTELRQSWESVSELVPYEPLSCVMLRADGGTAWDAPVERLYFAEDGQGGTYQLTVRYFTEAEEGHGVRLTAILNTFRILTPQQVSGGP